MASGNRFIFLLRKITKRLYKYRGLSRVADLVRMAYIQSPLHFLIDDFDGTLFFNCALDEHISSQVFWRGYYSSGQLFLLRKILKPDMVFLDAGANKGEFTVFAAKYLREGKVIAFEPVERLWEELKANIAANHFQRVLIVKKALSNANKEGAIFNAEGGKGRELNLGTYTLYPGKDIRDKGKDFREPGKSVQDSGKNVQNPGKDIQDREQGIQDQEKGFHGASLTVDVIRLDDFDPGDGGRITRLDVMKVDIEGGELDMLQGAAETIRRCKPVIFIEINAITCRTAGYEPAAILDFLRGFGYHFATIGRNGDTRLTHEGRLKDFQNLLCLPAS